MRERYEVILDVVQGETERIACEEHAILLSTPDGRVSTMARFYIADDITTLSEAIETMDYMAPEEAEGGRAFVRVYDRREGEMKEYETKGFLVAGMTLDGRVQLRQYRFSSEEVDVAEGLLRKTYFEYVTSGNGQEEESGWTL